MVQEVIQAGWRLEAVVIREESLTEFLHHNEKLSPLLSQLPSDIICVLAASDFQGLSSHTNPEGILAVVEIPTTAGSRQLNAQLTATGGGLLLERIQDPGNLGTLLRIADWFGISHVYCSEGTVDLWNAKVLRASMGAVFRVQVQYVADWSALLSAHHSRIWLADMEGNTLQSGLIEPHDWLLVCNEAQGPLEETRQSLIDRRVTIPGASRGESLNVAVAGGILTYMMGR